MRRIDLRGRLVTVDRRRRVIPIVPSAKQQLAKKPIRPKGCPYALTINENHVCVCTPHYRRVCSRHAWGTTRTDANGYTEIEVLDYPPPHYPGPTEEET